MHNIAVALAYWMCADSIRRVQKTCANVQTGSIGEHVNTQIAVDANMWMHSARFCSGWQATMWSKLEAFARLVLYFSPPAAFHPSSPATSIPESKLRQTSLLLAMRASSHKSSNVAPLLLFRRSSWSIMCIPCVRNSSKASGPAVKFCMERLNATMHDAISARASLLPNFTRPPAEVICMELQRHLALNDTELRKVLLSSPALLSCNFVDDIEPTLSNLMHWLILDKAELRSLVLELPAVLGASFEDDIEPKLMSLIWRLGLRRMDLRDLVLAVPQVLNYSFEGELEPKLSKLVRWLALSDLDLHRLVRASPQLLVLNFEDDLEPKLLRLMHRLELSQTELRSLVLASPPVLIQNFEDVTEQKIANLMHQRKLNMTQLRSLVLTTPSVLGSSIESTSGWRGLIANGDGNRQAVNQSRRSHR